METGCTHQCGCHNQNSLTHDPKFALNIDKVVQLTAVTRRASILGGEPLAPENLDSVMAPHNACTLRFLVVLFISGRDMSRMPFLDTSWVIWSPAFSSWSSWCRCWTRSFLATTTKHSARHNQSSVVLGRDDLG